MPKTGFRRNVAMLSQPFWLMASAPWPGLKRTNEYPPNTSILSDDFCAKSEKLAANTKKLANSTFLMKLIPPFRTNSFAFGTGFPGAVNVHDNCSDALTIDFYRQ